jgi:hypothetical protein
MELVEFLLARIGEDEAVARGATAGPWRWDENYKGTDGKDDADLALTNDEGAEVVGAYNWHCCDFRISPTVEPADAEHIARWDPARVLAECEAKRRIVELHTESEPGSHECPGRYSTFSIAEGDPCPTVLLLALPYASHPDYDPAWNPEATA